MFLSLISCYIIITGVIVSSEGKPSEYAVCHTSTCYKFAKRFQNAMNRNMTPCTDFYEFGCGLWGRGNHVPRHELTWSTTDKMQMRTRVRIEGILQRQKKHEKMPFIKMAKQYYHSCMDEDTIENQGMRPLQEFLDKTGGWPLTMATGEWDKTKYTWQSIHNTYIRMFFNSYLFNIGFQLDNLSPTRDNILTLSQGLLYRYNKETDGDSKPADIKVAATRVALALIKYKGYNVSSIQLYLKVRKLVSFERRLKEIIIHANDEENEITDMTIAELQTFYDLQETKSSKAKIDWLSIFQDLFKHVNISIDASEPVLVYNKHFLHKLADLLDNTPPEVIVNYIQWNVVKQLINELNEEMRDIAFKLTEPDMHHIIEPTPRWIKCVDFAALKHVISYMFVNKYISKNTVDAVTEMVDDIKTEMIKHILKSELINDKTKEFMIDKIEHVLVHIGYPEWYNDQTEFFELYKGLEIGENYFQNVLNYIEFKSKFYASKFRKPFDRNEWFDYPISHRFFYVKSRNLIELPAAEIQDPYFSPSLPLAVNYGAIGFSIAHELAHAFDSTGIQYDKLGRFIKHTESPSENYKEGMECFVDQYNNFSLTSDGYLFELDGENTKDENIADSIGAQIAFAAFQNRKKKIGRQAKLPYMEHVSDEALFYLSIANAWCSIRTSSYEVESAKNDEHSPDKFRINSALANTESFSKTFLCSISSPMNPASKCKLI